MIDRQTIHIHDLAAEPADDLLAPFARSVGIRTILTTPLLREDAPIGAIMIRRTEVHPFTEKHIKLLETFADQAVIAIENVRLFTELEARNNELRVALEQQTATSELLKVIGRSTFDLQPVFETLAENAVRLCDAERALIERFDGEVLRLVADHNASPELRAFIEQNPIVPGRHSGAGRAALERRTIHIHDTHADAEYTYTPKEVDPLRTLLAIPMIRADELLGVIVIYRHEVRPFTDGHIALMETFADQAAIAIENARLFQELKESLEQQTATSEILGVIASSPTDIKPVLNAVAESAARLCDALNVLVYRLDGDGLRLAAQHGPVPAPVAVLPLSRGVPVGRAVVDQQTIHIPDVSAESDIEFPEAAQFFRFTGTRTILATPLLRESVSIGAIVIRR
jgi:two-component system, NtrC family, sensor kinase